LQAFSLFSGSVKKAVKKGAGCDAGEYIKKPAGYGLKKGRIPT